DVYDALISARVYKPAFTHEKARDIIVDGKGSHFDPDVVDAFLLLEDTFQQIAATFTKPKQEFRIAA
ncbi:MAG: metal-dependent phosphohydrolase, partial [Pseudomonadota bacterium]